MQLRRKLKRVTRRLLGRADPVILMYHRVAAPKVDPWELSVHPDNFAAQMRVLAERRRPVPLDWLVDELRAGRRPERAVAITFDDAYRDVLQNAKPVLTELGIPATVFVVTGLLGAERGFWWDRLAGAVFGADDVSGTPKLSFVPSTERAELPQVGREALHLRLWNLIRVLDPAQREAAVDETAAALGQSASLDAPVMTTGEIGQLIDGGMISVGAHTVSHPSLPSLSTAGQRAELDGSRRALEDITGQPIHRLAYPFGDYDDRSEALARELGFDYAVSVEAGPANDPRVLFRLPRYDVKNWTGPEFRERLKWFN